MKKSILKISSASVKGLFSSALFILVTASFFTADAYFTTRKDTIVDRVTGAAVQLKGFGLGCWLLPEGYMWGSNKDSPRLIEQAITDLIGKPAADTFWNLYHWNFLVEQDIKDMKGWGINAVRVALLGALLQPRDSQPKAAPYIYNDEGWRIHDSLVIWCERWQVGIIWDMHAAPGGQNNQNISDADGTARLWTDTATYWPRTRDLWYQIAARYKDRKCIVGYDLLNEPLLSNLGINATLLRKLYVQLTSLIRTVDTTGIIFVEGQWWARDFAILEPLTWDNHLVVAFHEYPPVASWANMAGNANGTPYDWKALRTKYTIPLWHGETGEQGPPYDRNAQSTDFLNANNIGWSWWTHKKFNNSSQPWNCPKTAGFQTILNYWNNGGTKPSASDAKTWLFDQARKTNRSYCQFLPAMVTSLHPLNPNGVVSVKHTGSMTSNAPEYVFEKPGKISIELAGAQVLSVEIIDIKGRIAFRSTVSRKRIEIDTRPFRTGLYVLRVMSDKASLQPRTVVLHP
jgi:endoglucanase